MPCFLIILFQLYFSLPPHIAPYLSTTVAQMGVGNGSVFTTATNARFGVSFLGNTVNGCRTFGRGGWRRNVLVSTVASRALGCLSSTRRTFRIRVTHVSNWRMNTVPYVAIQTAFVAGAFIQVVTVTSGGRRRCRGWWRRRLIVTLTTFARGSHA